MKGRNYLITAVLVCTCSSVQANTSQGRSPFQVDNTPAKPKTNISTPAPLAGTAVSSVTGVYLTLNQGRLLSQEIQSWAELNGMRPLWNSSRDYVIYNTISLSGKTRDDILTQLGQLFSSEHYGLVIKLYEKNNVLVIDAQ